MIPSCTLKQLKLNYEYISIEKIQHISKCFFNIKSMIHIEVPKVKSRFKKSFCRAYVGGDTAPRLD